MSSIKYSTWSHHCWHSTLVSVRKQNALHFLYFCSFFFFYYYFALTCNADAEIAMHIKGSGKKNIYFNVSWCLDNQKHSLNKQVRHKIDLANTPLYWNITKEAFSDTWRPPLLLLMQFACNLPWLLFGKKQLWYQRILFQHLSQALHTFSM